MDGNLGKFISEKRKAKGLTQKQLSEMLYVSESTISKWEKNVCNPDISMVSKLAEILGVTEHEFIIASEDKEEQIRNTNAKKWKTLTTTLDYIFIISYSIALLTCFICNIAVNKTLSWFFIVLFSIILSASFTTIPKFIPKMRLLFITLIELASLTALLLCCEIYTNGSWFILAFVPVLVAFVMIFLPLYIKCYKFPKFIKDNNALFSVSADIVMILLMLAVINDKTNGSWFVSFALPLTAFVAILPLIFVIVCRYLHINKCYKTSILTFTFVPFTICGYYIIKDLCLKNFGAVVNEIIFPNFAIWNNDDYISANVIAIILLSIILISLTFLIFGIIKSKKNKGIKER